MEMSGPVRNIYVRNNSLNNMKRIILLILVVVFTSPLFAESLLRPINMESLHSDFLQAVSVHPFEYGEPVFAPVYSWLSDIVPTVRWTSYGDTEFHGNYKVSLSEGGELYDADDVRFVTVAYTKGDYAVVICSLTSYADIDEHRLYTYGFGGNIIDSLVFHRFFVTEDGRGFMPLSGALLGNLDVMTCEIKWADMHPCHPVTRNLNGGKQQGQRVDSFTGLTRRGISCSRNRCGTSRRYTRRQTLRHIPSARRERDGIRCSSTSLRKIFWRLLTIKG